ncbi:MAG TPA: hypothetical protein VLE44_02390 [Candidatus Saccharimonadales bacterium]|nr:hypothetical protein [Candidatus Saccharimonadales bacterium]
MSKEIITAVNFIVSSVNSTKIGRGYLVKDVDGKKVVDSFSPEVSERDEVLTCALRNNVPFVQINMAHKQDVLNARTKKLN